MAKINLKFLDVSLEDLITIECYSTQQNIICIKLCVGKSFYQVRLDKSTAIKFAKTLRTEINKIPNEDGK